MLTRDFLANTWQRMPPDALETITYYSKATERIPVAGQAVGNVHRLPIKIETIGNTEDADLARNGIVFDMWKSQMGNVVWGGGMTAPKRMDVFDDSNSVRYVVRRIDVLDMGERYRLSCLQAP